MVHAPAPPTANLPAAHGAVHATDVSPPEPYTPGPHAVHAGALPAEKLPAGHAVHAAAPAAENVPAGQLPEHAGVALPPVPYVTAAHSVQADAAPVE